MLHGMKVVVTGSTTGIGAAIARAMLDAGARVVINSHEAIDADTLADYRQLGECEFIQADLSKPSEARRLVENAFAIWDGLDCLVNNAGTYVNVDFMESMPEDFNRLFDLNVRGYYFAAQAFARVVGKRHHDASIICTGSTNSLQAENGSVMYDTSKGAVLMLMRGLAVTLAGQGIRVNGIGPGLIETVLNDFAHRDEPDVRRMVEKQIPLGRVGVPDDIGGAAVFLASSQAKYITGQMVYIDGGMTAQQIVYN